MFVAGLPLFPTAGDLDLPAGDVARVSLGGCLHDPGPASLDVFLAQGQVQNLNAFIA